MMTGFTVRYARSQAEFLLSPPDQPPALRGEGARPPLVTVARDAESQTALALIGRLDYRDELTAVLPEGEWASDPNDARLALAVYRHADTKGLQRLEGEFALVIWDARQQRLIGMRDPFGAWPLFWCSNGSSIAMGTSLNALANGQGRPPVDLDYVAEFLSRPFVPSEVSCERTVVQGIQRVLPGTLVRLSADGRSECVRYWDWPSRIEQVRDTSLDEVTERFQELLRQAVRQRIRAGRIGAHLSGGMDSSSVAILARQWLADTPGCGPLVTMSLTYAAPELAGERSYIDLVLAQGGPIEPHFIQADPAVGFDWFAEAMPRHDEPYVGLWSLAANRLLVEAAEQRGVETILTGVGADEILSYRPLHIADLIRRGGWLRAYREASLWAAADGQGVWSVLHKCGLEPLRATRRVGSLWPLRRRPFGNGARPSRYTPPAWIAREFVRKQQLHDRYRQFACRLFANPAEHSETLTRVAMTSGDWARWYLHAPRSLEISHPFQDPRVVCYALGIPRNLRAAPGEPKPLLQAAMRGVLPEAIRTRKAKTGFNGPHSRGLAKNLPALEELVRHSRIRELGILDVDQLLPPLRNLAMGIDTAQNEWFDRTLALIAWYGQVW
jgi:asparagine synthase (glutamine-hydrolysing)